jgi:uncharacterized protein YndB with AHSA1/START domain
MTSFSVTVDIQAPPARVWAVLIDVERWHEWTPTVTSITRLDTGLLAAGSQMVIRQPKFPAARWAVVSVNPGRAMTSVSRAPGVRVIARQEVESVQGGTRATLSLAFEGFLAGLLGLLTGRINERYLNLEAAGLKSRCERPDSAR